MSGKSKRDSESELKPKLRFPEYRDATKWQPCAFYDLLDDVLDFRGRTPKKLGMEWGNGTIVSLSANNVKNGFIDFEAECNLGSEELYENWMGQVDLQKDDIVFTMEAPLGNALLIPDEEKYILSQRVVAFKTNKDVRNAFLVQLIWSEGFQRTIKRLSTGSTAKGINQKTLKKVSVALPDSAEQEKIAACLSSLDELIAAESRKLETLQAHKKGLMQQLFPREGETIPRLRFPEFKDAPEWEEYLIDDLVNDGVLAPPKDGNHGDIHPKSSDFVDVGIPFIMANDIRHGKINYSGCSHITKTQADRLRKGFAKEDDVLLTHKGTVGEVTIVRENDFPYLMLTPQVTYYRVKDDNNLSNEYLAYLFTSPEFQRELLIAAGGATRAYIGITAQRKLSVCMPVNLLEQKQIADCLLSIDDRIRSQLGKVEAFKNHKKGLMQQLFPSLEESYR